MDRTSEFLTLIQSLSSPPPSSSSPSSSKSKSSSPSPSPSSLPPLPAYTSFLLASLSLKNEFKSLSTILLQYSPSYIISSTPSTSPSVILLPPHLNITSLSSSLPPFLHSYNSKLDLLNDHLRTLISHLKTSSPSSSSSPYRPLNPSSIDYLSCILNDIRHEFQSISEYLFRLAQSQERFREKIMAKKSSLSSSLPSSSAALSSTSNFHIGQLVKGKKMNHIIDKDEYSFRMEKLQQKWKKEIDKWKTKGKVKDKGKEGKEEKEKENEMEMGEEKENHSDNNSNGLIHRKGHHPSASSSSSTSSSSSISSKQSSSSPSILSSSPPSDSSSSSTSSPSSLSRPYNPYESDNSTSDPSSLSLSASLTPLELHSLRVSHHHLLHSLVRDVHQIEGVERKMTEISQLINIFSTRLSQQDEQIDAIFDRTVQSSAYIVSGVDQLKSAGKRGMDFRMMIMFIILVLSFSLLFLDWYI